MANHKGLDVSVFTLGGTALIGVLKDAALESNVLDEDSAAVNEIDEYPEWVARTRRITGSAHVDDVATFLTMIEGAEPIVTFSYNTGANTYSGSGLLSRVTHNTPRKRLQEITFEIKVYGDLTVTAP